MSRTLYGADIAKGRGRDRHPASYSQTKSWTTASPALNCPLRRAESNGGGRLTAIHRERPHQHQHRSEKKGWELLKIMVPDRPDREVSRPTQVTAPHRRDLQRPHC